MPSASAYLMEKTWEALAAIRLNRLERFLRGVTLAPASALLTPLAKRGICCRGSGGCIGNRGSGQKLLGQRRLPDWPATQPHADVGVAKSFLDKEDPFIVRFTGFGQLRGSGQKLLGQRRPTWYHPLKKRP